MIDCQHCFLQTRTFAFRLRRALNVFMAFTCEAFHTCGGQGTDTFWYGVSRCDAKHRTKAVTPTILAAAEKSPAPGPQLLTPNHHGLNVIRRIMFCTTLLACTACAQPQALPTVSPVATALAATPTIEGVLQIDVADLYQYRHPSSLFVLRVPQVWAVRQRDTPSELITQFTDPRENGVIVSNVLTMTEQLAPAAITAKLQRTLRETYGSQPGFVQQAAVPQPDGGQVITWHYDPTAPGEASRAMQGRSTIRQSGEHVALLTVVVPSDQVARLQPMVDAVFDSYSIRPQVATAASNVLVDVTMLPTQPYTHTANLFRIDAPLGWSATNQSREGQALVTWADPSQNGWLLVHVVRDDSQRSRKELAGLLTNAVTDAFGTQPNFSLAEAVRAPDGRMVIIWIYTTQADNQIAVAMHGTGFVEQRGALIAIVGATIPMRQAESLEPAMQALFASFALNESAAGP